MGYDKFRRGANFLFGGLRIGGVAVNASASEINKACDADALLADGLLRKGVARATFEATGGKAIGAYDLGVNVPAKAIITRTWYDVITTFTSAGADAGTIALHAEAAGDIKAAIAVSDASNPWDAGRHDGLQAGAVANFIKATVGRALTATVAGQALTAGKMVVFAEYVVSL